MYSPRKTVELFSKCHFPSLLISSKECFWVTSEGAMKKVRKARFWVSHEDAHETKHELGDKKDRFILYFCISQNISQSLSKIISTSWQTREYKINLRFYETQHDFVSKYTRWNVLYPLGYIRSVVFKLSWITVIWYHRTFQFSLKKF